MQSVTSNAVADTIFDEYGKRKGSIGVVGGAYGFDEVTNIGNFIDNVLNGQQEEGGYGIGGIIGGSINVNGNGGGLGIPDGWYNILYLPHRDGYTRPSGGDTHLYGVLLMFDMTTNSNKIYVIHRIGGINYTAYVK